MEEPRHPMTKMLRRMNFPPHISKNILFTVLYISTPELLISSSA